ncbi:hypothetical protein [Agaribacterium sp. ZY112]|uniref:hypothetical protein n=1 Tax=Agaribacterium sp. ZY112 TaxID=3233574 RepID=UPI00352511F5
MINIKGSNWQGVIECLDLDNNLARAHGVVLGYTWYMEATESNWRIEIAEDPELSHKDLPLVGFGCGGWLNELIKDKKQAKKKTCEAHIVNFINASLILFSDKKLNYIPASSCNCSDSA